MDARHIQDYDSAESLEPHWGYHDRVVPCTNDAGSCEYLDLVYGLHDVTMLYSGIMYAALGGLLFLWAVWRYSSTASRLSRTISSFTRRHTLRELRCMRWLFGRVTRLQIILLAALTTYLIIFSFVGMEYKQWITPVKNMPGVHNTRTTLGIFANRLGVFAYALTPISILLGSRESLLSAVTGVPYQHFNFLHRWTGHIIMFQSVVHTIGWCIVEIRLYQPQPKVAVEWITQLYMVWGIIALILILALWLLATPWSRRRFGHEFFRKAHWVLAMLFIGACWGHWDMLKCFMLPSLLLWFADRGVRLLRTALIHYRVVGSGHGAFTSFPAVVTHFDVDVVRLDIDLPQPFSWDIGQHYFLTFPKGSIWQSHPFTPLSLPGSTQSYIIRAKGGETKKLIAFAGESTPVILTGAYGGDITRDLAPSTNVLCIAGGTGITFVLPVLLLLARLQPQAHVQLIWVVRHARDTEWIAAELAQLTECGHISVMIHATRDDKEPLTPLDEEAQSGASSAKEETAVSVSQGRPDLHMAIETFLKRVAGPTKVYVSGPCGIVTASRESVSAANSAKKVWRGEDECDVELIFDDRLE